ncbi:uncharacterized protein [Watersipora subatra]|uniref:uncharacterized protein n=1 Tax=Watersipora subatra TaxID=2589382 RepID=UPI00355C3364
MESEDSFLCNNIFNSELYEDITMHPFADITELDYDDMTKNEVHKGDQALASPTLTGEELNSWQLNEVFQDLDKFENEPPGEEVSLSCLFPSMDGLLQTPDLLAEAFKAVNDACPSPHTDETSESAAADFLPVPVTECTLSDASIASHSAYSQETLSEVENECILKIKLKKAFCKTKSKVEKSRKQTSHKKLGDVIPKPHETQKAAIRRVKNNAASRVFRSRKKNKLEDLIEQEEQLDTENRVLRRDLEKVEEVVRVMKECLVSSAKCMRN